MIIHVRNIHTIGLHVLYSTCTIHAVYGWFTFNCAPLFPYYKEQHSVMFSEL